MPKFLLAAQVTLGRLNRRVAEQKLDLFQFATRQVAQPRATAAQIVGAWVLDTSALRSTFHNMPDRFRRDAIPQTLPIRFTRRKIVPPLISAHAIHASMARFTQPGTGTVRMCFPLPIAHDDVIRHLCEELNATETLFPGTGLKLIYKLGSS